jgi:hypothetical protein
MDGYRFRLRSLSNGGRGRSTHPAYYLRKGGWQFLVVTITASTPDGGHDPKASEMWSQVFGTPS